MSNPTHIILRHIKIQRLYRSRKEIPVIRLEGEWIGKLGFKIGQKVSINIREQLLIIEPIRENISENELISYKNKIKTVQEAVKVLSKEINTKLV